jgi:hypothetical protein
MEVKLAADIVDDFVLCLPEPEIGSIWYSFMTFHA